MVQSKKKAKRKIGKTKLWLRHKTRSKPNLRLINKLNKLLKNSLSKIIKNKIRLKKKKTLSHFNFALSI